MNLPYLISALAVLAIAIGVTLQSVHIRNLRKQLVRQSEVANALIGIAKNQAEASEALNERIDLTLIRMDVIEKAAGNK